MRTLMLLLLLLTHESPPQVCHSLTLVDLTARNEQLDRVALGIPSLGHVARASGTLSCVYVEVYLLVALSTDSSLAREYRRYPKDTSSWDSRDHYISQVAWVNGTHVAYRLLDRLQQFQVRRVEWQCRSTTTISPPYLLALSGVVVRSSNHGSFELCGQYDDQHLARTGTESRRARTHSSIHMR